MQGRQGHHQYGGRAVGIGDDAAGPAVVVPLDVQQAEMSGVHLGYQQRHFR